MIGSLLIFMGFSLILSSYFMKMRDEVFSDMKIAMIDPHTDIIENNDSVDIGQETHSEIYEEYEIDYSKYYGVLQIPKIGLKRGFHNVGSRYNSIEYNVSMVGGSTTPTEGYGNLILMAHSGDAYNSYFAYLYRLDVGDDCYVTIFGQTYHYQITKIYDVGKSGAVTIDWNRDKMSLTMITCTKDNDSMQTIYIAELVS